MKKTLILIAFLLPLISFSQKVKKVERFDKLKVSTDIQATLVQSDHYKVEYKMMKGDDEALVIENKGNTLVIKIKSGGWFSSSKAMVTIYAPELQAISISAGASLVTEGTYVVNELNVSASSGASTRLDLEGKNLNFDVSSGASLSVKGSAHRVEADVSSGGSFNGKKLMAKHAEADVSSGGMIKIHCTESIDADASSGGSIKYFGNPKKKNVDSGYSGSISKG